MSPNRYRRVRSYSSAMEATRPLHDVFSELAGAAEASERAGIDPAQVLRANGHEDLPDGLVAEAVVNYADTAPVEVAEHLSAFVRAHSAVPSPDDTSSEVPGWFEAVSSAPVDVDPGERLDLTGSVLDHAGGQPRSGEREPAEDDPGFGHGGTDATAAWSEETMADTAPAYAHTEVDSPTRPEQPEGLGEPSDLGPEPVDDEMESDPAGLDDLDG